MPAPLRAVSPRPDHLTAAAVRDAAQRFLDADRTPPTGLGPSRVQDVWIDLDDGLGPQAFPPKVILWMATGGALPKQYGYASDGPWRQRLRDLGFPVLPKGQRPSRGQSCRGADRRTQTEARPGGTRAKPLPHVASRRALTRDHILAAARANFARPRRPDPYDVWVGGQPYPFWPLFREATRLSGGVVRKFRRPPLGGNHPEHNRLRELRFDVLPHGIAPVAHASGAPARPVLEQITVGALRQAATWIARAPQFRASHAGRKVDLWIDGHGPYPVKAMCLLAFHSLGLGWHESWIKGGVNSSMDRHLRGLPGVAILPKGQLPDTDADRARSLAKDLEEIAQRKVHPTTRQRLVDARLGQGQFRKDVEKHWDGACAVTGVTVRQALRASHIVPWADPGADDAMRLNPHNGLLLVATLDALFDRGWISFDDKGALLVHDDISPPQRKLLGLTAQSLRRHKALQALTDQRRAFLKLHRAKYGYPDSAT